MDYGMFTGIGYYTYGGTESLDVHAGLKNVRLRYWQNTDEKGYAYGDASEFWQEYFKAKKNNECEKKGAK